MATVLGTRYRGTWSTCREAIYLMGARLGSLAERLRISLFFVPSMFVLAGIVIGLLSLEVDERLDVVDGVPFAVASTVESARAILSTVAGATITVAGIAFSISLLIIQLASSQYSPRVIHGLFRDPFNKRAIGVVVGTFTFCLVVLRAIRASGGPIEPVVPNLSVTLAVLFGIAAILVVIAFINHNAHAVDVSEVLRVATEQTIASLDVTWPDPVGSRRDLQGDDHARTYDGVAPAVDASPHLVRFDESGWVQTVDERSLARAAAQDGTVRFETAVGRYAIAGTPLCTVWPPPTDASATNRTARAAVALGSTRTLAYDPTYGIRQVVDVAIKALSPGVNDPTTAQDAVFHLGEIVREFLGRQPPPRVMAHEGRVVILPYSPGHQDVIRLAFEELRSAAAPYPTVCGYIFEVLHLVSSALDPEACAHSIAQLRQEAHQLFEAASMTLDRPDELAIVRRAHAEQFGAVVGHGA
jgi:uncharacterized membrane protein